MRRVFPAMIRKFHEVKANGMDVVRLWGDGLPLREFLFAGDLRNPAGSITLSVRR